MIISVIGGDAAGPEAVETAQAVGRALAKRGVTLLCGGRGGVMEAACKGARSVGGHTIGIMPGHDAQESPPNKYVEFPVYTGLGYARNITVVLSGEAIIAIDGSYGTLSEIAYALIHEKPIVGLNTWDFAYHGHDGDRIVRASSPAEAVETAVTLAMKQREVGKG